MQLIFVAFINPFNNDNNNNGMTKQKNKYHFRYFNILLTMQ